MSLTFTDLVRVEEKGDFALIQLNRPEKMNAMSQAMRTALVSALDRVRGRFPVCIVTGSGRAFCAGVDLEEIRRDMAAGRKTSSEWIPVLQHVRNHPSIFIAAVNGFAFGGGLSLVCSCDLAIASEGAVFAVPEISMGSYPTISGTIAMMTVPRKPGASFALGACRVDATKAAAIHLVNKVVPADGLMAEAERVARSVVLNLGNLAQAKSLLNRQTTN